MASISGQWSQDSPVFRKKLATQMRELETFESHLGKVLKNASTYIRALETATTAYTSFMTSSEELLSLSMSKKESLCDVEEGRTHEHICRYMPKLKKLSEFYQKFSTKLQRDVVSVLEGLEAELKPLRTGYSAVKSARGALDDKRDRHMAVLRNARGADTVETTAQFQTARTDYISKSHDFVLRLNVFSSKRNTNLLTAYLNLAERFYEQFRTGIDFLTHFKGDMEDTHTYVLELEMQKCAMVEDINEELRGDHGDQSVSASRKPVSSPTDLLKEGYLYKKNRHNIWQRRWFLLKPNRFSYRVHKEGTDEDDSTEKVLCSDMKMLGVKLVPTMLGGFQLIQHQITHDLQAESMLDAQEWQQEIERVKEEALVGSSGTSEDVKRREVMRPVMERICLSSHSQLCAECSSPLSDLRSTWVSLNIGCSFCPQCSGAHRNLGVSYSTVRSLCLDHIPLEHLLVWASLGNAHNNAVFEGRLAALGVQKPQPSAERDKREIFLGAKYKVREFATSIKDLVSLPRWGVSHCSNTGVTFPQDVYCFSQAPQLDCSSPCRRVTLPQPTSQLCPNELLLEAASVNNVQVCQLAIANGASIECRGADNVTPLIRAAQNNCLAAATYLTLNGAACDSVDSEGHSALVHSARGGHVTLGAFLLLRQLPDSQTAAAALAECIRLENGDFILLLKMAESVSAEPDDSSAAETFTDLARRQVEGEVRLLMGIEPMA